MLKKLREKLQALDSKSDGFLYWIAASRWSALWLASIFVAGWLCNHYYEKLVHADEYATHEGYELCLEEVSKVREEFQSLLGE